MDGLHLNRAESKADSKNPQSPQWFLAELTYRCPLACLYCSNPVNFAEQTKNELSTAEWIEVLKQAREMGAVQLGFSGGEPLLRKDLEQLVSVAAELGFYTNLITSGLGLTESRIKKLKDNGLDHIQLSFEASTAELNNQIGGKNSFEKKMQAARLIKKYDYPMVMNVVIHRLNIDSMAEIIELAVSLDADYLELANTQYYGWALKNRNYLLPTREQISSSHAVAVKYIQKLQGKMKIYYVMPDYFQTRPKACSAGWGKVFLLVNPSGTAYPCHGAHQLPLEFSNVRDIELKKIWYDSPGFNKYRGSKWMKEPCSSCPEKEKDFGGCRCQTYQLLGDAGLTDPVCDKSEHHQNEVLDVIEQASMPQERTEFTYRR